MLDFIAEVAGPVLDCEIDERLQERNHFFRTTCLTVDDLNVYTPLATIVQAARQAARGEITMREAMATVPQAIEDLKEIEAVIEAENASA